MIIEKFITYDYSKIADWLIKTGVVLLAAALIVILGLIWLKVTAKNVALNMMARAHREQKLFISMCEVPESAVAGTGELPVSAELLFQNMMTEDEIHLLKRIVLEKATYLELAKELNISVWACQKRMQRLLKKLKHSLDDG